VTDITPLIRRAASPDAPDLARMHVESWRETYPGLVPAVMLSSLSVDARTAAWSRILSEPARATAVFVAELDGRIVAFGSCGPQRSEALRARRYDGEISTIYVLQAFQRRALGTRLLAAMASRLEASGFRAASLWVLRENAPARRFYERHGGQVIAEREDARPEGTLLEVAYGWVDVADIVRSTARVP
jgi:ribosomal protein S18 acetylase RimI-like enzyme